MNVKTRQEFGEQYRPYNTMREFSEGIMAYMAGDSRNPYRAGSVQAQAWDCGFALFLPCRTSMADCRPLGFDRRLAVKRR
jgi:hypothetical protein